MAHTCPDCGQACYCNGDIDDCILDIPEDVAACIHCTAEYDEGMYDDYDETGF